MLDTGDTTSPRTPYLHMVRPASPVWVDLAVVFPVTATSARVPDGLDLTGKVPGLLSMWRATTTGHWVGWATFALGSTVAEGGTTHSQWVLGDALSPRDTPEEARG